MKPTKSAAGAAKIGAFVGATYSLFLIFWTDEYQGAPAAYLIGLVVGGLIGGALLFTIPIAIRNLFVNRKK